MNPSRFIERCRSEPAILKGLAFARDVGQRNGRDLLAGLEELRRFYLDNREEVELSLDLLAVWVASEDTPEEIDPDPLLGVKGC